MSPVLVEQPRADFLPDLRGMNPNEQAFKPQCEAVTEHCSDASQQRNRHLTLFALAFGSFCIGTSEFASMGIIQLFSASLGVGVPQATNAIAAYAFGCVIGAPLLTLTAAQLNRRTLLLCVMGLFILGNLLSAMAGSLGLLMVARFISGMPQGAYFGAGAVVASYIVGPGHSGKAFAIVMTGLTVATIFGAPLATFLGQNLGWRETYAAVACLAVLAFLSLLLWVPRTDALKGNPVMQELSALRKPSVWGVLVVAASGVASIFAVYTFIGPLVTDGAGLSPGTIPIALALFGIGMTAGNLLGGRLADSDPAKGILIGFGCALLVLAILATGGSNIWILMPAMFGVGATMMTAIPTLQVRLTRFAPEAPSLVGAMNLAALNTANAIGAWAGGIAVGSGFGLLSAVWAGFGLTLLGLIIFGLTLLRGTQLAPALNRQTLLLWLMGLFILGDPFSAAAQPVGGTGEPRGSDSRMETNTMNRPIVLGQVSLSFYAVTGAVVQEVIERLGHAVEVKQGPHEEMFPLLGRGEIDIMAAAWLPEGHASYWAQYGQNAVEVAKLYDGARFFWGVPAHVAEVDVRSIEDLAKPAIAARMTKQIQGIGSGAAISTLTQKAVEAYGLGALGYTFRPGTPAEWTGAYDAAVAAGQWIVFPSWAPQYLNRGGNIRPLTDPKGVLGGVNRAVLVSPRDRWAQLPPSVQRAIGRIELGLDGVTEMDWLVNDKKMSARDAARVWMTANADRVSLWLQD